MAEYIVDTTDGILNARTTGELVRCGECIHLYEEAISEFAAKLRLAGEDA